MSCMCHQALEKLKKRKAQLKPAVMDLGKILCVLCCGHLGRVCVLSVIVCRSLFSGCVCLCVFAVSLFVAGSEDMCYGCVSTVDTSGCSSIYEFKDFLMCNLSRLE